MVLTLLLIATLALLSQEPLGCNAVSLMQRIRESPNLTTFSKLLYNTSFGAILDSNESCSTSGPAFCYLVFAPSNDAFLKPSVKSFFNSVPLSFDNRTMLAQHIVSVDTGKKILLSNWTELDHPAAVGREIGLGRARVFNANGSVLFWQAKQTSDKKWLYHANNAAVNLALSNQEAANGALHVLDDVILPLSRDLSLAALLNLTEDDPFVKQIGVSRTLKTFKDWMSGDAEFKSWYEALLSAGGGGGGGGGGVRTAFLPTDAAWSTLPQSALTALNASARWDLLAAHLVPDVALFTKWLAPDRETVDFAAGHPERKQPGRLVARGGGSGASFVSAGGVFAGLVAEKSNLALRDAAVHTIDRVLAAPPRYHNLSDAAGSAAPRFLELCLKSEACKAALAEADKLDGPHWTLFAPTDVSGLRGTADLESILLLHFVPNELIPRCNMTGSLLVSGARNSGRIRFRPSSDFTKLWIEGRLAGRGYVRSELVASDEATRGGGLLHTVRTPLGWPALSLKETIAKLPQLSTAAAERFESCIHRQQESHADNHGNFTAFVLDDRAMEELKLLVMQRNAAGNGTAGPEGDGALDEAICSFVLPEAAILADSPAEGSAAVFRNLPVAKNGTVVVKFLDTTDRVLELQLTQKKLLATAPLSNGQYQCTDGLLYVISSVQLDTGRGQKSQMILQKGAVSIATAAYSAATLMAVAAGTILCRRLLFN